MKKLLLTSVPAAIIALAFFACTSGNNNQSESTETETEADTTAAEAAPQTAHVMTVWHDVADYDAWKAVFDANDSIMDAYGLKKLVVGHADGAPNTVFVASTYGDLAQARAFAGSDALKSTMERAGVTSEPDIQFSTVEFIAPRDTVNMDRLMIVPHVQDYDSWKAVFDSVGAEARAGNFDNGMQPIVIGRDEDDSNLLRLVFKVNDRAKAEEFLKSDKLKELKKKGGVDTVYQATFFTVNEFLN